jgi:Calcineurin-like phosphoesterase
VVSARVLQAVALAQQDARAPTSAPADGRARSFVAIGDPQAPLTRFLDVLDVHGLLGDDGRLRSDVGLISIGDHFDWGPVAARARAAHDGLALLAWLAAHPRDQAILIAGNHDLARVCELWDYDDGRFMRAQALADGAYFGDDAYAKAAFHAENPTLSSAEMVARDLSTFKSPQRDLVSMLLEDARLVLAHDQGGRLFVHAGVTVDELEVLGLMDTRDAATIARALNDALREAWRGHVGALVIPGLHAPGDAVREGEGMLFHRASVLDSTEERALRDRPAPRRRFSPQRLPRGLVQVIGHIQDKKTRTLLALDAAHEHGRLRTLDVDGPSLRYTYGVPAEQASAARVIHIDAGMQHVTDARAYALFDVETGRERLAP